MKFLKGFLARTILPAAAAFAALSIGSHSFAAPDPNWLDHDRTRPNPTEIDAGTSSTEEKAGRAPSDATVLFDGKDLSQWVAMDGSPTKWRMGDGYMECVKGSGYVRSLQNFGDCQLHVEWATPTPPHGEGQGRGNSGVFFGMGRYEIQVLDSFEAKTYADGQAAAIYGQYPPLVNASRAPGKWQNYDIIYTAPRFNSESKVVSPVHLTVFHNGVLVQNNVELTGPTSWLQRAPYEVHPEKNPIALQDHGNPVRFRNIWVRELGRSGKKEFTFANSILEKYAGLYEGGNKMEVRVEKDQVIAYLGEVRFVLFAESETHFFAKTTDLQVDFQKGGDGKVDGLSLSVGESHGSGTILKKKR